MKDLSSFKGIIFDMDGTLVDSMGRHINAWQVTCEVFGYPFDANYIHSLGGVPTLETVEMLNAKYNIQNDVEEVAGFKKRASEKLPDIPMLIPDTLAVFNHYIKSHPISVGTGSDRQHAEWLLSHHNIIDQLKVLVTADDVKNGKPHPETFLMAAEAMHVAPEDCVVFEDTEMGQRAALDAGMTCVMVKDGKIVNSLV